MRIIKFLLIFFSLFVYLILGYLTRLVLIAANSCRTLKAVSRLTYYLMHVLKGIAGIKITVSGKTNILKEKSLFIISTHVGYLDGIILGTLVPGSFTTKSDIKKMPFFGQVISVGGSIFVDRKKRSNVVTYIERMTHRLKNGINVFHFPEGHATDGTKILPFFSAFFNAPIKAKSSIVPVTIKYTKVNGSSDFNRDEVYHYGKKDSITKHFWNILKFRDIQVVVTVHDKIMYNGHSVDSKSRKLISNLCVQRLSYYTKLPVSAESSFDNALK